MFDPKLEIGQVIDNNKLCRVFQCSPQGGMRKSNSTNTLVLVANYVKGIYHDKWIGGVLHYTGMGLNGDQDIDYMQNYTLNHADKLGVDVFLFEVMEEREYTFCGRVQVVDEPYTEEQLDEHGNKRKVWMFPIKPVPDNDVCKPSHYVFRDMDDYIARGKNVDKEYADYRNKQKKSKETIVETRPALSFPQEQSPVDTGKLLQEHLWLKGIRVRHIKYGVGTIKEVTCVGGGNISILVEFDKEINGIVERILGYKFCISNNLLEILH